MAKKLAFIAVLFACFNVIQSLPEPGIWEEVAYPKEKGYLYFVKSLYKDSIISVTIQCTDCENDTVTVDCVLRYTPCSQEYQNLAGNKKEENIIAEYFKSPDVLLYPDYKYTTVEYMVINEVHVGHSGYIQMTPKLDMKPTVKNVTINKAADSSSADDKDESAKTRRKREDAPVGPSTKTFTPTTTTNTKAIEKPDAGTKAKKADPGTKAEKPDPGTKAEKPDPGTKADTPVPGTKADTPVPGAKLGQAAAIQKPAVGPNVTMPLPNQSGQLVKIWKSGYYLFIIRISDELGNSNYKVTVSMKGSVGYISAVEWPLLIFYGVMGLVYIFYACMWLVMLACNWRDLLRVQYWIGAVILLGMLEKAVFYGDYQSIANNGKSWTEGAVIFAEIVSCLKRALARMLVIIVSLGFGIVKPRLGTTLHKVLFVGGLYFLLATVEGCMRGLRPKGDQSTDMMLAAIPLAIVDASICWWIFSSLVQTTRQLRLRRNIVKLTLYRHFTNTLVFAVLASIIFMIWSIIQIKTKRCIQDWQELWIDEAFWHLLFSVLLLVIMILWRPATNNQRYAFSPLLDNGDDDEEEETVMNDAFDGMKMRPKQVNGSPKQKQNTIEDELKWVEENIPSSISDTAQSILESDEEIMTAKYEMSKMQ